MLKKLLSTALAAAMLGSMAVIPAHAATFSSANWAQYEQGFYTSTSNFSENKQEYTNTSFGDNRLTSVRMVANTSSKITSTKNPVAYKIGQSASDYGDHASDNATYAHMVFYLATYDDANHNLFDDFYLRMDKDGTGSSRGTFTFDNWKYDSEIYADSYTSSAAYTTKDWTGILKKQGYNGNGPTGDTIGSGNEGSTTRVLADSDYDKIDIIVEYNKQGGATTYIFANGKFMADFYDSGLTDKHFHGIVFRTPANKTPRNNSSYIAVKMDPNRIGHREYYNTDDYYVTLEDVMNDAGLGDSVNDSSVMFKTSEIQNYMPGNNQSAYTYETGYSARQRINTNVTYSGNEATIAVTNTSSDYATAAKMLSGVYPVIGKMGVAYESYHPRAKYIKLSFDQTISNDGMWLEYATKYSGAEQALQMWNNGGNLVVGVKGSGSNVTCNGSGKNPSATMTGTNHIDWILEPVDETNVKQYVFVNNKLAAEGHYGGQYSPRINDIILSTKNAAGNVKINNWDMTVYNETANLPAIAASITNENIIWGSGNYEMGYEKKGDKIAVLVTATNNAGVTPSANTKVITAIYDNNGRLVNAIKNAYVSGQTLADETVTNTFDYSSDMKTIKAFVWDYIEGNIKPQISAFTMTIE